VLVAADTPPYSRSDIPCQAPASELRPAVVSGARQQGTRTEQALSATFAPAGITRQAIQGQQPVVDPKREFDRSGIAGPFETVVALSPTIRRDSIHGRQ
jgi:hypothetical protein